MCVCVCVCVHECTHYATTHTSSNKGVGFHHPLMVLTGFKWLPGQQGAHLCCLHEWDRTLLTCQGPPASAASSPMPCCRPTRTGCLFLQGNSEAKSLKRLHFRVDFHLDLLSSLFISLFTHTDSWREGLGGFHYLSVETAFLFTSVCPINGPVNNPRWS